MMIFGAVLCRLHDSRSRVHNGDGDLFFFTHTFLSLSLEINVRFSKNYLCSRVSIFINFSLYFFYYYF
jgi:hypothetical protein